MSEIKVNKISPKQTCTQLTLGDSGDTIIIPAGVNLNTDAIKNLNTSSIITQTNATTITLGFSGSTIAIASGASQTGFGRTGSVNWDTTPKTTTVTAVSGNGYFINTTSGAITVNLPAGVAGDIVAVSDYANTAATNNITISPNGTDKINGVNQNARISTNGASATLLYVDSTRGWKDINDATLDLTGIPPFVAATGGTITTCGNYKIHTFTGPGTFTVTTAGSPAGSNSVDYLVIAGGGGGTDSNSSGGGGAGGYRESKATGAPWTASPLASSTSLPVSVTAYPITVGAGGSVGGNGNPSIFSTITSTGGGTQGNPGGSGGGGNGPGGGSGSGNTPPVSPSQGFNGGPGSSTSPGWTGGGGGGATQAGQTDTASPNSNVAGPGGAGTTTSITGSSLAYAGGGGGGQNWCGPVGSGGSGVGGNGGRAEGGLYATAGTANRGGGGGGGGGSRGAFSGGAAGGSGIVVIRYKFQ